MSLEQLAQKVVKALDYPDPQDTIHECGLSVLAILSSNPSVVRALAYSKLHVYPFSDVPIRWRRAYEEACLWEIAHALKEADRPSPPASNDLYGMAVDIHRLDHAVRLCDRAIIFSGAPRRRQLIDMILDALNDFTSRGGDDGPASEIANNSRPDAPSSKRRRLDGSKGYQQALKGAVMASLPSSFPQIDSTQRMPVIKQSHQIKILTRPSLSHFAKHLTGPHTPVILRGTIDHWPARYRWANPNYWLSRTHGGQRLVPVELGSSYTDESWGQKIMPFGEYLSKYVLGIEAEKIEFEDHLTKQPDALAVEKAQKGYLAQHDLLSQIPALRADIAVPDFCYAETPRSRLKAASREANPPPTLPISSSSDDMSDNDMPATDPQLNIWLGPHGTVSPAHTDPHENILAQVVGRKYVRLFAPSEMPKMYPMGVAKNSGGEDTGTEATIDGNDHEDTNHGIDMQNTSRVDVGAFVAWATSDEEQDHQRGEQGEQGENFPDHASALYVEGILEAGDCLYVPLGWWHYVHSLCASCSVSFWWD